MTADDQELNTATDHLVPPLTSCATESIALAESVCRDSGHEAVIDCQLLFALAAVPGSAAGEILTELGMTPDEIQTQTRFLLPIDGHSASSGEVKLSPRVARVIDNAFADAAEKRHDEVSTLHLLHGLVKERQGLAAFLIESPGLGLEQVGSAINKALREGRTDRS